VQSALKRKTTKKVGANGVIIYSRPRVLEELEKASLNVLQRVITIYCVGGGGRGGSWCRVDIYGESVHERRVHLVVEDYRQG
jgi:hypothetical protein